MRWRIVVAPSQPPNLNKEETIELIDQYQKNPKDSHSLDILVRKYRGLVESLAKRYSRGKALHEDLTQVGMIGLLSALKRYDPEYGKSFESYAVPTIVGEMKRFIRDKTWSVHVPRRIKELGPRIKKTIEELTIELQRSPKIKEIAEYLDVSEEEILETMEIGKSYHALSVDSKIESDSEGSTVTLLDMVGDQEKGFDLVDKRMLLEKICQVLTEREQQILKKIYFHHLSQKEAGEQLGISQMHVSRLQRRALKKLKEAVRSGV